MIQRKILEADIALALGRSRAVALNGPRQAGKTTLAKKFVDSRSPNYFDLEDPDHLARLANPIQVFDSLKGLVVIDEVQRMPGLFPTLRVLIDRSNDVGQFLLLGSASPTLLRQAGESLLGRIETVEIAGFNLAEIRSEDGLTQDDVNRLWFRGGFPRAYLAKRDHDANAWCRNAIANHVGIDLPQFGVNIAAASMLRFWTMLAHYHGQIWNASEPAKSLGVSQPTVRKYLDVLTQSLMIRQLQPWHENILKRQVKSPKIYFRDTGLLHTLMGIRTFADLVTHPRCGSSWEGFALEQVVRIAQPDESYFWASHQGAELDLLMIKNGQKIGVEFKQGQAPKVTESMRIAKRDLKLNALYVVYPGLHRFPMAEGIEAVPLNALIPESTDRQLG